MPKTGVYPVYENQFQVGADIDNLNNIADMVRLSLYSGYFREV